MKKIVSIVIVGSILLFSSCSERKENVMSGKAVKNLEAMHGINNCFIEKDFNKLGNYVAENCIDHSGGLKGLKSMKAEYEKWAPMFKITRSEVIKELSDDEFAMVWMRFSA